VDIQLRVAPAETEAHVAFSKVYLPLTHLLSDAE